MTHLRTTLVHALLRSGLRAGLRTGRASGLTALIVAATMLILPAPALAIAGDETTEDIVYMVDGRELHGQILDEKRDVVIFEFIDRSINVRTRLTLMLDEIARIDRDVAISDPVITDETDDRPRRPKKDDDEATSQPERSYGAKLIDSADADVPTLYVVPMKGQMGTDVTFDVYEKMVDDIRAHAPDYLVFEMDCADEEDRIVNRVGREEGGLVDIGTLEMYQALARLLRADLRDIPQVLWVHDSLGASSVMALSWDQIYMKPTARFGGVSGARRFFDVADENVEGKFRAAYMAVINGIALYGGHAPELMEAMVRPQNMLSASWKGRDVEWRLDTAGEYIVDDSDSAPTNFSAKDAEDLCISNGTAETLDDLALLLGVREYRLADGEAQEIYDDYVEDWRRTMDNCRTWLTDAQQARGWATGEDTERYLGQIRRLLENVIRSIDRYKAVETRLAMELGVRKADLVTQVELIREQLAALRRGGRGGGGGGRGTGIGR